MADKLFVKREDPFIGKVFDRKYRIDRLLGVGGTGTVYGAWHLNLDRAVALKMLHPHFVLNPKQVERFRQEARLMSMVGHDAIVAVIDFRISEDRIPYLAMELVEGENLRERLRRGPLRVGQALALFRPLCEALAAAHRLGVIHRDLKPDNLMLQSQAGGDGDRERLKILDFGASKLLHQDVPLSSLQSAPGTPYYLAPERLMESQSSDHRVDIFSIGAILYEVISGAMAFGGETPTQAMFKIIDQPVPRLGLPDTRLSEAIDAVIAKACAKDPGARYSSAGAMLDELEAAALAAPGRTGSSRPGRLSPLSQPARPTPPRQTQPQRPAQQTPTPRQGGVDTAPVNQPLSTRSQPRSTPPAAQSSLPASFPRSAQSSFPASFPASHPPAPGPATAPQPPRLLSDGPALGSGVKQAVMLHLSQQLAEMAGDKALLCLGADFMPRLSRLVLTDWVDGVELRRLFACAGDLLGGEGGQHLLGRALATVVLSTLYKSLIKPGEPEFVVRRMQVILRLFHSDGESTAEELSKGHWRIRIARLRTLDAGVAAGTAGFIEGALMMAGALQNRVSCLGPDDSTPPSWTFDVSFEIL